MERLILPSRAASDFTAEDRVIMPTRGPVDYRMELARVLPH